jgi:flagellar motor switch protein FliM
MPEVLNKDEVDALLGLVNQGEGGREGQGRAGAGQPGSREREGYRVLPLSEVHLYDFKRPERVSKDQVVALEALHEVFARNLSASLSGYLRTVVEVRLISVEQFTYSEFTMSLPSPTSINLLSCAPLQGNMILEMNPSIIFPVIDRLLGGGTTDAYLLDRPFTQIELGLVNSILARITGQLTLTWDNIRAVRFEIQESESNPFLMQIVAPNEPIVLLSFEVLMGEYSGMINLCIPFKVVEPILGEFVRSNWFASPSGSSRTARNHILQNIGQAEVDLTALLAEMPLRLADLLTLRAGDILDTRKPLSSELSLLVGSEHRFDGRPGLSRGKLAFRITHAVDPKDPAAS